MEFKKNPSAEVFKVESFAMEHQQKFEDESGELDMTEDYVVFDDATTGSTGLDLSNLRKRKTKIISSAKETIENGE